MTKDTIKALKEENKRFTITMMNKNGYTVMRKFTTIQSCKTFAKHFPLSVFFAWIYDKSKDSIIMQNNYSDKLYKCNEESFIPYWC